MTPKGQVATATKLSGKKDYCLTNPDSFKKLTGAKELAPFFYVYDYIPIAFHPTSPTTHRPRRQDCPVCRLVNAC